MQPDQLAVEERRDGADVEAKGKFTYVVQHCGHIPATQYCRLQSHVYPGRYCIYQLLIVRAY